MHSRRAPCSHIVFPVFPDSHRYFLCQRRRLYIQLGRRSLCQSPRLLPGLSWEWRYVQGCCDLAGLQFGTYSDSFWVVLSFYLQLVHQHFEQVLLSCARTKQLIERIGPTGRFFETLQIIPPTFQEFMEYLSNGTGISEGSVRPYLNGCIKMRTEKMLCLSLKSFEGVKRRSVYRAVPLSVD